MATPLTILGAACQVWLRADFAAYQDVAATTSAGNGDPVARMDSLGTLAASWRQSTAGDRPTLVTGVVNGHPVLRGDGAGDRLLATLALSVPSFAIWVVGQKASNSTNASFVDLRGTAAGTVLLTVHARGSSHWGGWYRNEDSEVTLAEISPVPNLTIPFAARAHWDGTTVRIYRNGSLMGAGDVPFGPPVSLSGPHESRLLWGEPGTGAVDLAEFVLAVPEPTATQVLQVDEYLHDRYDLTALVPHGVPDEWDFSYTVADVWDY